MRDTTSGATARLVCSTSRKHAVDAEADDQAVLVGLDVDIRGVLLDRLRQQRVDQANDRRFVVALEQIGGLGDVLGQMREIGIVVQALQHLHGGARARLVGDAQQRIERLDRDALELQGNADEAAHLGEGLRRDARAAHRVGALVGDAAHQHAMTFRKRKRQFPRLDRLLQFGAHGELNGCGPFGCGAGAGCALGAGCGAGATWGRRDLRAGAGCALGGAGCGAGAGCALGRRLRARARAAAPGR